ncbi:hypothetical protein [Flavobacterium sp. HNIBRBA15423]|uniref:hypothetical protein n=1 Tax=Flavobacterium sp. HNIBRBA15423 TaxID=3458683 RepID=UPI0040450CAC
MHLINVLNDFDIRAGDIEIWLEAYDAFWKNAQIFKFDGATIVYDLDTIKDLDAPAMVHDYEYQLLRNKGFIIYLRGKLKADANYGKNMRKVGITWLTAWSRVSLLVLSTPIWLLILISKGKVFKQNKFKYYSENHPNQ